MNKRKIVVIDYGIGNVKSMCNALSMINEEPLLSNNKAEILSADALILPGVGAFRKGMENLFESNLVDVIHQFIAIGKPLLGICLGMQMLLDESEEFGFSKGLGLIRGKVVKLPLDIKSKEKLPHVSWNEIHEPLPNRWKNTMLEELPVNTNLYFVHSFVAVPTQPEDILSTSWYGGVEFCSAVNNKNVFGTQFHPEKSGPVGLGILKKFINLVK